MRLRAVALLLALAGLPALAPLAPASAAGITVGGLSEPGTSGAIRVLSIAADKRGVYRPQTGDPNDRSQDPSRTVGDVPSIGDGGPGCAPVISTDCFRSLAVNEASVNASATDGHAHYHAGDTSIVVTEVKHFRAGDTIMIGSPHCNYARLGLTCERYLPGFGMVREQPTGEIVAIEGGDVGPSVHGPGVLRLSHPLAFDHRPGEQVVKLPTVYPGHDLRIDVPNAALLGSHPPPLHVRATFIPPQGSRIPWDAGFRRPLARATSKTVFEQIVHGPDGTTSFWMPREITYTTTAGRTFSIDTEDSWYTIEIVARDGGGRVVQDGVARFKTNPLAIPFMTTDPQRVFPGNAVQITGWVRDGFSPATMSRRVEDIDVNVVVTKPRGSQSFKASSCYDSEPGPDDICGGDPFGATPNQHGNFNVRMGGTRCNEENLGICMRGNIYDRMGDTQDRGTYTVTATVRGVTPAVRAVTTFRVAWPDPLDGVVP
ncbi:MAG TPA: hypothetical protein VM841_07435 [Actinomycetota bacterium]|nr:hypothetical protein [Actinomycetota bacterium]